MHPNPDPNQKNNPKCRPRILNPDTKVTDNRKGRLFEGLVLGLGILDYPLNLSQCLCNDVCSWTKSRQKLRQQSSTRS